MKLLKAGTTIDESCVSCHAEKRGPFLWEHAPVAESCTTCHDPHGSNNERMLVAKQPFLCQRCHVTSRHPPTVYDGFVLKNSQNANKIYGRSCVVCHQQIHGSNAPSGKALLAVGVAMRIGIIGICLALFTWACVRADHTGCSRRRHWQRPPSGLVDFGFRGTDTDVDDARYERYRDLRSARPPVSPSDKRPSATRWRRQRLQHRLSRSAIPVRLRPQPAQLRLRLGFNPDQLRLSHRTRPGASVTTACCRSARRVRPAGAEYARRLGCPARRARRRPRVTARPPRSRRSPTDRPTTPG